VVRRIFAEYLDSKGDRAIATGLNRDNIPCPSARRPDQNRHRLADGWQGSTVRAILENPRYTGYAFFGRWTKHETLLNPDDVAAGHVVRFRRSGTDRIGGRGHAPTQLWSLSSSSPRSRCFDDLGLLADWKPVGSLSAARKRPNAPTP
jgi:hypothetical protein